MPISELPDWLADAIEKEIVIIVASDTDYAQWNIKTLEGVMLATPDDYIIQGIYGELYPCKKDIFEKTYDKVEE